MLKFRTEAEVLKEWDDMIARVKAGEVPLENAEAFMRKKGSWSGGTTSWRIWGDNVRRRTSSLCICIYNKQLAKEKWDRASINRLSWTGTLPSYTEEEEIYREWVHLALRMCDMRSEVDDREQLLAEAIIERRGFEAGTAKGNERALTLADEMTEMKIRHKEQMEELKARQNDELRLLQEKYKPWWEKEKIKSTDKGQLQGEFSWLYQRITNDENSVRAWGRNRGLKFDALREEILTVLWEMIPEENRKGVWMADDGSFSYESLKRHYREHLGDFEPATVKNPEHIKPGSDDDQECGGDQ